MDPSTPQKQATAALQNAKRNYDDGLLDEEEFKEEKRKILQRRDLVLDGRAVS